MKTMYNIQFKMESTRQKRKRCDSNCKDHEFLFQRSQGESRYDLSAMFCPRYQRQPLPTLQTHPIFNQDKKYFTAGFILGVDKKSLQSNTQQQMMNHQKLIKEQLEKNNQICFPRPNLKHNKQPTCQVCKQHYANYYGHIVSEKHKDNIQANQYNPFLLELCENYRQLWEGAEQRADNMSESDFISSEEQNSQEEEQQRLENGSEQQQNGSEQFQGSQNSLQLKNKQSKQGERKAKVNDSSIKKQIMQSDSKQKFKRSGTPLLKDLLQKKIIVSQGNIMKPVSKPHQSQNIHQPVQKQYFTPRIISDKRQNVMVKQPKQKNVDASENNVQEVMNKEHDKNIDSLQIDQRKDEKSKEIKKNYGYQYEYHPDARQIAEKQKKGDIQRSQERSIEKQRHKQKQHNSQRLSQKGIPTPSFKKSQIQPYSEYIRNKIGDQSTENRGAKQLSGVQSHNDNLNKQFSQPIHPSHQIIDSSNMNIPGQHPTQHQMQQPLYGMYPHHPQWQPSYPQTYYMHNTPGHPPSSEQKNSNSYIGNTSININFPMYVPTYPPMASYPPRYPANYPPTQYNPYLPQHYQMLPQSPNPSAKPQQGNHKQSSHLNDNDNSRK